MVIFQNCESLPEGIFQRRPGPEALADALLDATGRQKGWVATLDPLIWVT